MGGKTKNRLLIILVILFLMVVAGLVQANGGGKAIDPGFRPGTTLVNPQDFGTSKENNPSESALPEGAAPETDTWSSRAADHAKGFGLGLLVGASVAVGIVAVGALLMVSAPVLGVAAVGALVGGALYGLFTGAARFNPVDAAVQALIGGVSAGVGFGLGAAGFLAGRGLIVAKAAIDVVAGGLGSMASYLIQSPQPSWGGAATAFGLGAGTAGVFLGLGYGFARVKGALGFGGGSGAGAATVAEVAATLPDSALGLAQQDPVMGVVVAESNPDALRRANAGALAQAPVGSSTHDSVTVAQRGPSRRPSWRDSELSVGDDLKGQGFEAQKSFKGGQEVPYGTRGSSRPEYYKTGFSVEVKNYDVTTPQGRSNLARNISGQAKQRQHNLPSGTRQTVIVDIRGQNVPQEILDDMARRISDQSGGAIRPEDIIFKR